MSEREIRRETALFLDSAPALALGPARREAARRLVEAWLACCYAGLGKAPQFLDGEDVRLVLGEHLPAHLGVRDPLAEEAAEVLEAFIAHLEADRFAPNAFEQRRALEAGLEAFLARVRAGDLAGRARALPARPLVHQVDKVGRNDPCPCGSQRKFKQCCLRLGA